MIRLYGTIRKGGKLYASCFALHANGTRTDFQLIEKTHEEAFAHLRMLKGEIDAAHPRRGESGD